MHTRIKLGTAGLAATLLMGLAVASASANRLSVSNQQFRIVWGQLLMFDEGMGASAHIRCPVTLEGSFHSRTFAKVSGALIGNVTRAIPGAAETCAEGSATMLTETLPWPVTYASFSGTLPRITRVRVLIRGVAFDNTQNEVPCLFKEDGRSAAAGEFVVENLGLANRFEFDHTIRLPKFSGSIISCPPETGLEGTGEVTLLGTTTRIRISLI